MPQLFVYPSNAALPAHYECQVRSFKRIMWFDAYQYNLNAPLVPEDWHPTHVVLAEQHALLSYAGVVWRTVTHAGQSFKTYGLSSVLTYPAFRRKGYARQVVDTASDHIRADPEADIAILFTEPGLEGFYKAAGWQAMPEVEILIGKPEAPQPFAAFTMMLFLSERGQATRGAFNSAPVYFGRYEW